MRYVASPYLRYYQDKKNVVFNFLVNRFQSFNKENLAIYRFCLKSRSYSELKLKFAQPAIDRLIKRYQLLDEHNQWKINAIRQLEIETSTLCNWRCRYCPVHYHKRETKVMDPTLFTDILDKALQYPSIEWISLHLYNEPTIDPNFMFYLKEIQNRDMRLLLYTNGSNLTELMLNTIKFNMRAPRLIINLPTTDSQAFYQLTGSKRLNNTIQAINNAVKLDLDVSISVQGTGQSQQTAIEHIQQTFPDVPLYTYESYDRAGALNNEYGQNITLTTPRLAGCFMVTERAILSVDGDLLLCCNDYHQIFKLGNIRGKSLHELLSGSKISGMRQYIWGANAAPNNLLCRKCVLMKDAIQNKIYRRIE